MKKLLKIMYLLLLPIYSAFGQNQIGLSVGNSALVAGDTISVPVYVDSSLTGKGVSSYNMQFSFNNYYFIVDSVYSTGTLTEDWGAPNYNISTTDRISVAGAGDTDLIGKGILFYLHIKAIRSGNPMLSFTDTTYNYFNEGSPRLLLNNGRITISAKQIITVNPNSVILTKGDTKQFTASNGTAPISWSLTNSSIASIDASGLLNATGKGLTKVIALDANGIIDTSDGDIEIRAFKLSTKDTSHYQGQTVDIPVYTSDLTGLNYTAGEFSISINGNILVPIEIITSGTLLSGYSNTSFSFRDGKLNVAFAGTSPLVGSGELLIVRYQITSTNTGSNNFAFSNILFNETDFGNGVTNRFNVIPLATLNISPSTGNLVAGETLQFSASNGTPPYSWSVSNSALATIDVSTGLLTAIKGGIINVSATDTYGGSGVSGNINLYDTEVSIPDTTTDIGTTIDIPVYMGSLAAGNSVLSLQTDVLFDSSKIVFKQLVTSGTLTDGWFASVNDQGNKISVALAGSNSFGNSGVLFLIRFTISGSAAVGNYSNITLQNFMFNEGSPNARINDGRITIATSSVPETPDKLIAVPLSETQINLLWSDKSNNESGFKIERTTDTTGSWTNIANISPNTTSYTDASLSDGAKYFYRVYAYNSVGNSAYSNVANAVTPLNAPSNLDGAIVMVNNVDLTWTDNSSNESGFILERKTYTSEFSVIDTLSANLTQYYDSSLILGEYYTYRIKAFNDVANSNYSNTYEVIINNPYPTPPSNLGVIIDAVDSSGTLYVSWNDNSSDELGFILERSVNTPSAWAIRDSLSANVAFYTDSNLMDGTKYFYRVTAYNASGYAEYSNVDSAITIMNAPTNLTVATPDGKKVPLTWDDNSESELGYIIERQTGIVVPVPSFVVVDTVLVNVNSFVDSTITTDGDYVYRVRGFNANVNSKYSNPVAITVTEVSNENNIPTQFNLSQNYPNPFNPSTMIKYSNPEASNVQIVVYNLLGEKITSLVNREVNAGFHEVSWNASNVPSGIYLISVRFQSNISQQSHAFTKKAILLK